MAMDVFERIEKQMNCAIPQKIDSKQIENHLAFPQ